VTFVVLANGTNYNNNNIQQPFLAKLSVTSVPGIRTNASLKEMTDNVVEGYRLTLTNFQIQSYANITLSGNNAIKISYSYTDPKNNGFKATDIVTIKNNTLYVIQYYYVQSPRQQTYLQTLQKMVNSFQIIR
jgi:hypothetical protein